MRKMQQTRRNKWKIGRICAVLFSIMLAFSLCGCGMFASLDLTEEESGLIAEYAAGLLKKYNRNGAKLMNPDTLQEEETAQQEEPEEPEIPEEEPKADEPEAAFSAEELSFEDLSEENPDELGVEDVSGEEIAYSSDSMAACLGLSGIEVNYQGYDVCDTYPDQPDNSWLISMSARKGKKLVVVRFELANNSSDKQQCDILNAGKQYRLIVNNEKRINETVTVLMDSFSQYSATLDAGASEEAVLIFELDEELVDQVNSLDLVIKDSSGSETFKLM